jgi:hypothetical protein
MWGIHRNILFDSRERLDTLPARFSDKRETKTPDRLWGSPLRPGFLALWTLDKRPVKTAAFFWFVKMTNRVMRRGSLERMP